MLVQVKNNKGISLIALVVTIIVLIILAGISLSLVVGEDGLIKQSKSRRESTLNQEVELEERLNEIYKLEEENIGDVGSFDEIIKKLEEENENLKKEKEELENNYQQSEADLASLTSATATEEDILEGKTAWVNGIKLTGTNAGYDAGYSDGYNDATFQEYTLEFSKDGNGTTGGSQQEIYCYLSNYTSDYANLTVDNIVLDMTKASIQYYPTAYGAANKVSITYDSSTGKITMANSSSNVLFYGCYASIPCYIIH